jgi:hypothetical protein
MNKKSYWKIFLCALLLTAAAAPLFAQTDIMPAGMVSLAESILKIFTGRLVQIILICCLAGCAVAYGFNKDNEKMKRNIVAIAVAIGILVASSTIVDAIWKAAN